MKVTIKYLLGENMIYVYWEYISNNGYKNRKLHDKTNAAGNVMS